MKRLVLVVAIAAGLLAGFAQAQEKKESAAAEQQKESKLEMWKWANFLLLAGALGYLIKKNAGGFFATRIEKIQQGIVDAKQQRAAADERAADVDRRLSNLESEIAGLRSDAEAQAQTETERAIEHTAAEIAKIQAQAEREIAAAGKAARMDLKRYSAELAVELAEQKIRARMTGDAEDNLVQGFVHDLKHPAS